MTDLVCTNPDMLNTEAPPWHVVVYQQNADGLTYTVKHVPVAEALGMVDRTEAVFNEAIYGEKE